MIEKKGGQMSGLENKMQDTSGNNIYNELGDDTQLQDDFQPHDLAHKQGLQGV
jgi:hypothetical protein